MSQATVATYMIRHRRPPSQTWRTFLTNHATDLVAADFFTGFSGMLSFELNGGAALVDRFIKHVTLPIVAPSLGGKRC